MRSYLRKVIEKIRYIAQIDFIQFIRLNYLDKAVQRNGTGKIIPYKYAVIELESGAQIIVGDNNIEIGTNRLKKSKAETRIRLRSGAVWNAKNGCAVSYGVTIELLENAVLSSGYFTINSNSVMIAAQKIELGEDVMIARNVVIYDSDFHALNHNKPESSPVNIGDHVWLGANSMILKGSTIGNGSMIAANTLVTKNVEPKTMVCQISDMKTLMRDIYWKR